MAREVVMPQLGLSMDSGRIARWVKQSGDRVEAGDVLLEVESDKATVEVEAVASGILHIVRGAEDGVDIAVGEVIAYLLAEGEEPPAHERDNSAAATVPLPKVAIADHTQVSAENAVDEVQQQPRPVRHPATPAARRRAKELGVDWRLARGTGPGGQIKERDVIRLAEELGVKSVPSEDESSVTKEPRISSVALRLAESVGLDVAELARRYPNKRLERTDVEQAIREMLSAAGAGRKVGEKSFRRQPMTGLRRLIADRMAQSAHTNAPVTLTTEADATELVRLRAEWKADPHTSVVPGYNVLLAKLVARALLELPDLNASLDGDEIVYWETVHIGIAVDSERGLVVPVFRDVQAKSIHELVLEMEDLLSRAKEGKAMPDELTGSTFTITNLGPYEIDAFTPIINPPECAVLGVGQLKDKWVVVESEPVVRTMLALSLTFDHRLVDGAPAARFLQRVKQLIERPVLGLV
jgi:pyruvate dehydrogenase E2 component (dihydrolipoamide acetyltransferase)